MARHTNRGLWKQATWEPVIYLTEAEEALLAELAAEVCAAIDATEPETTDDIAAYLRAA